jgi:hypothetical protein
MVKTFKVSEMKINAYGHLICPECRDHEQGYAREVMDCKNVYTDEKGNIEGQCNCYSKEHGVRK